MRRGTTTGLGGVLRVSLSDFYFHSLRLVPPNLVWGATAIALLFVGLASPVIALLLSPLLAIAGMAVFRVAAGVVRHEPGISIREAIADLPRWWTAAILLGVGTMLVVGVLVTNVLTGLSSAEPAGWAFATLAGWGLVAWWTWLVVAWPLVVDPARAGRPLADRLRLAATVAIARPGRFGTLGLLVAVIVVLSTILTAAILTISVAFVALVASRAVYPIADQLDGLAAIPAQDAA